MGNNTQVRRRFPFLLLTFCSLLLLTGCGSRKFVYHSATKAAKAADAMSHLHNKALYRFVTNWAGVKYRTGGMDKRGVDCSGFALLLNKEIYGRDLPRRSADQATVIREKNQQQLEEGDLVFFSFGGKVVDHVGIYLSQGFFVHASTTRGVIVDDLNLPAFQRALVKAGPVIKN